MAARAQPLIDSFDDGQEHGWVVMQPLDLLAFHKKVAALPDHGFEAYDAGTREGARGQEVRVYGTTRSGADMQVSLVAAKLVRSGPEFEANIAKLAIRAGKAGMPFDPDSAADGIALAGVEAEDFTPGARNAPRKVLNISVQAEDDMASFIRGAREANLLQGITIKVIDCSVNSNLS